MKRNVIFRQLVNLLDDTDLWIALVFAAAAAFFSYSSWVAPAYRDEMVLASIAGTVASATGIRGVLLAFAASHATTLVKLVDKSIDAVEKAAGVNLVPDDLQSLGLQALLKVLQDLKNNAATIEAVSELQAVEDKIKALWPKG